MIICVAVLRCHILLESARKLSKPLDQIVSREGNFSYFDDRGTSNSSRSCLVTIHICGWQVPGLTVPSFFMRNRRGERFNPSRKVHGWPEIEPFQTENRSGSIQRFPGCNEATPGVPGARLAFPHRGQSARKPSSIAVLDFDLRQRMSLRAEGSRSRYPTRGLVPMLRLVDERKEILRATARFTHVGGPIRTWCRIFAWPMTPKV